MWQTVGGTVSTPHTVGGWLGGHVTCCWGGRGAEMTPFPPTRLPPLAGFFEPALPDPLPSTWTTNSLSMSEPEACSNVRQQ